MHSSAPAVVPAIDATPVADRVHLLITAIVAAVLALLVLSACGRGIDFSDEGYYLNWMAHPELYPVSHTQFGFLYHPLLHLLGDNVVLMRQLNVLLLLGLAYLVFLVALRDNSAGGTSPFTHLVACSLAPSALLLLQMWIPTPSYNSLGLQSLLVAALGLLFIGRKDYSAGGWFVLGLGGALTFLAKPSSAAALAIIALGMLIAAGRLRLRGVFISVGVAILFLLGAAIAIDGSPAKFIARLAGGLSDLERLGGGYGLGRLIRWDQFGLSRAEWVLLSGSIAGLVISLGVTYSAALSRRCRGLHAGLALATIAAGGILCPFVDSFRSRPTLGLQVLAVPAAVAIVAFALRRRSPACNDPTLVPYAIGFALFPYAFALGTNNNYWVNGAWAGSFLVLSSMLLLRRLSSRCLWQGPAASWTLGIVTLVLVSSAQCPYRQTQPLWASTVPVTQGRFGPMLHLSPDFATYVENVRHVASRAGFAAGTPLLDLTGHYPTTLFLLGARPIGLAWMSGGYVGTENFITVALERVPENDWDGTWILTEPQGGRPVPTSVLQAVDLELDRDFETVGTLEAPTGTFPESARQYLHRPRR